MHHWQELQFQLAANPQEQWWLSRRPEVF